MNIARSPHTYFTFRKGMYNVLCDIFSITIDFCNKSGYNANMFDDAR